jgi:AsmA protein
MPTSNGSEQKLDTVSLDADDLRSGASLSAAAILSNGKRPIRLAISTPLTIQDDQVSLEKLDAVAISELPGLGESKFAATGQYNSTLPPCKLPARTSASASAANGPAASWN